MKNKVSLMTLTLMLASPALAGGAGKPVAKPATCKSIAAVVASDPQFSTLATALDAADLTGALAGKGSFTVFAPTNAAFAKVPSDKLAALLNDSEMLGEVLAYHVVAERASAAELRGASSGTTEQGQDVQIKVQGNQVLVNNARVVKADIAACNGVIHAIDTVLMPKLEAAAPAPKPAVPQPAAPKPAAPAPVAAPVTAPEALDITKIPALPLSGSVTVTAPAATLDTTTTTEVTPAETEATETATTETEATETATTETEATETATTETTEAAPETTTEVAGNTIYDAVVADEQFSTLRDLLSDADLTDLLMSGEYTLFAPTDAAFAALPEGTLAAIASDPALLVNLLKYHVVAGKLTTEQIQAGNLATAAGTSLTLKANLAPVIESSNGLIYPVDAVLLPEGFVVPQVEQAPATTEAPAPAETTTTVTTTVTATPELTTVLQEDRFSTVRELLTSADLLGVLTSGEYTVFLPTNDAFAKLDAAKLDAIKANPGHLKQLLNYFMVKGRQNAEALVAAPLVTSEGTTLTFTRDANGLSMDGVVLGGNNVIETGTSNVYVIDSVLLPPSLR